MKGQDGLMVAIETPSNVTYHTPPLGPATPTDVNLEETDEKGSHPLSNTLHQPLCQKKNVAANNRRQLIWPVDDDDKCEHYTCKATKIDVSSTLGLSTHDSLAANSVSNLASVTKSFTQLDTGYNLVECEPANTAVIDFQATQVDADKTPAKELVAKAPSDRANEELNKATFQHSSLSELPYFEDFLKTLQESSFMAEKSMTLGAVHNRLLETAIEYLLCSVRHNHALEDRWRSLPGLEQDFDSFIETMLELYKHFKARSLEATVESGEIEADVSGLSTLSSLISSDGTSTSSRRHRFGVTYSAPSITGISESEFMVP